MGKLSKEQIQTYFDEHLPYRNRILIAHKEICKKGSYHGDIALLQACFEASLITGRMYLNVLGLTKNKNDEIINNNFRHDDVSVNDLGGELVEINNLKPKEKQLLLGFLKMVDKGAAHLTLPMKHQWEKTHEAIDFILDLLQKHLYDKVNKKIKF